MKTPAETYATAPYVSEETKRIRASNAAAKRAEFTRKKASGLILKQLWIYPADWHKIRVLADKLTAATANGKGRQPPRRAAPRGRSVRL